MIHSKIVSPTIKENNGIDWDKPQILVSHHNGVIDNVVSTTGEHESDKFTATLLFSSVHGGVLDTTAGWLKSYFHPTNEPVTITFNNK
jgi:hypothetical protein